MSVWALKCAMDSMLMEVNWLNIVLVIESMIQGMVSLMVNLVTVLVLICRVAAFMILINAM